MLAPNVCATNFAAPRLRRQATLLGRTTLTAAKGDGVAPGHARAICFGSR